MTKEVIIKAIQHKYALRHEHPMFRNDVLFLIATLRRYTN